MRRPLMMHDWSIEHNTAAAKTSLWIYLYKTPIQLLICLNITYLHYLFYIIQKPKTRTEMGHSGNLTSSMTRTMNRQLESVSTLNLEIFF